MQKFYGLLILLTVLQAAAVGLVIRFAFDSSARERTLLERTGAMVNEILPSMKEDVAQVSQKTAEIGTEVAGVRSQVTRLDDRVGEVGAEVTHVGKTVDGLDRNLTGFVRDKTGVIWGHSLNPYLLAVLLIAMAVSIPLWGWFFATRFRPATPLQQELFGRDEPSLAGRLDKLARLVEKIRTENGKSVTPPPELQKLMEETEQLILEARIELAQLSHDAQSNPELCGVTPDKLH